MNGLMRIMTNGGGASKSRAIRNQHVPMPAQRGWGEASGDLPAKLAIETRRADSRGANSTHRLGKRESDSGLFPWQSLTRAKSCGRAPDCLWMDSGCGCTDSANHIS